VAEKRHMKAVALPMQLFVGGRGLQRNKKTGGIGVPSSGEGKKG